MEAKREQLFFSTKIVLTVIALIAAFVIVIVITSNGPGSLLAEAGDNQPTVQVSGAGSISVPPDMATVNLGVTTTEENPRDAIIRNNEIVADVLAAVKALGISEDDIATQQFSISQAWDHSMHWQGRLLGYEITNSVSVVIRDMDIIGEVLGAGVAAGANISRGIQFSVDETSPMYYEALELAIEDAANKARTIASALGTSVIGLVSVVETNTFSAPVFARGDAQMFAGAMTERRFDDFGVPIQPGDVTLTARVEVIYSLAQ
ncbi:MAG: SIMPL domain-containing protein [Defluviitaleaceae bacterium]|nr:SIMPL domain-containing protein [Defluviitaleaceae bacterium]